MYSNKKPHYGNHAITFIYPVTSPAGSSSSSRMSSCTRINRTEVVTIVIAALVVFKVVMTEWEK